jgi:anti-sigma regulatory factor (Ser/Thr protein kinase)
MGSDPCVEAFRLRPTREAPGAARGWLRTLAISPAVQGEVELAVSELITNGVRHVRFGPAEWIGLEVHRWSGWLRVEISHPGAGPAEEPLNPRGVGPDGGRGLYLVDQLAAIWGVERLGERCTVWATFPEDPSHQHRARSGSTSAIEWASSQ